MQRAQTLREGQLSIWRMSRGTGEVKEALDTQGRFPRPNHPLPSNLPFCRALARGVFGETYEGLVIGLPGDPSLLQVTIKVRGVGLLTESRREGSLRKESWLEIGSTRPLEVSGVLRSSVAFLPSESCSVTSDSL